MRTLVPLQHSDKLGKPGFFLLWSKRFPSGVPPACKQVWHRWLLEMCTLHRAARLNLMASTIRKSHIQSTTLYLHSSYSNLHSADNGKNIGLKSSKKTVPDILAFYMKIWEHFDLTTLQQTGLIWSSRHIQSFSIWDFASDVLVRGFACPTGYGLIQKKFVALVESVKKCLLSNHDHHLLNKV